MQSEYRTTYLEEYAGYDCYELRMERSTVEVELDPRWRQGYSSRNSADSIHLFNVSSIKNPVHHLRDVWTIVRDDSALPAQFSCSSEFGSELRIS